MWCMHGPVLSLLRSPDGSGWLPHPEAEVQGVGCPRTLTRYSTSSRGAFLTRRGVCLESGVPEEDRTLTSHLSGCVH